MSIIKLYNEMNHKIRLSNQSRKQEKKLSEKELRIK